MASHGCSQEQNPTPHLDELERALEIHLSPLALPNNGHAGDGSVKTCTVPSGLTQQNESDEETKREVWTWTPQTQNIENSYVKSPLQQDNTITAAPDGTTLEEMAPFSPEFYRAMGELAKEAFQPGSVEDLHMMDEKSNSATTTSGEYALSMEQRRRLAAVKVALIKSSKEECALGTEQRRRLATMKDVQTHPNKEECASGIYSSEGCGNQSKRRGVCRRHGANRSHYDGSIAFVSEFEKTL